MSMQIALSLCRTHILYDIAVVTRNSIGDTLAESENTATYVFRPVNVV